MFDAEAIKNAITKVIEDIVAIANRVLREFGYEIVGKKIQPVK